MFVNVSKYAGQTEYQTINYCGIRIKKCRDPELGQKGKEVKVIDYKSFYDDLRSGKDVFKANNQTAYAVKVKYSPAYMPILLKSLLLNFVLSSYTSEFNDVVW